jgi:hypothetical protein
MTMTRMILGISAGAGRYPIPDKLKLLVLLDGIVRASTSLHKVSISRYQALSKPIFQVSLLPLVLVIVK